MQIRYLEAMQAMAKSSNSKVIFLPGPAMNHTVQQALQQAGEGASTDLDGLGATGDFKTAIDSAVIQNI